MAAAMIEQPSKTERRDFLKVAGAALVTGFPAIISAQTVTNAIKVGLVGCGGRGTGAASQALTADDYSELVAVADIDASQIENSLTTLKKIKKISGRVKVEDPKRFLGLDAYKQVIDSGVDVVLLATPPGFRPRHLAACIDAGKHVFCEKPVSTDAPGIRSVLETVDKAKQKNLSLVAGFCWRYNDMIVDTFKQVEDGAIGKLVAYYATYYTSPVKPIPPASTRPAGMSDIEWQIRNWYNFVWLCGDSLVEQAVHSVDKVAWAMHDEPPVSCVGVGGRPCPPRAATSSTISKSITFTRTACARSLRIGRTKAATTRTRITCWGRRAGAPSAADHAAHRRQDQLDLDRPEIRHVSTRARRVVRRDSKESGAERRQAPGDQHHARDDGPHGRVYGSADHVGHGAQFAGEADSGSHRLERESGSAAESPAGDHEVCLRGRCWFVVAGSWLLSRPSPSARMSRQRCRRFTIG